ncbi:uncharacterized protein LOC107038835 [Diachasma alloeum]|uniref:uncharacterized protein LOC107038835 n=1 Tax=Diachasma alloeum TaxID=454923 RepID=UPI0007381C4A|nr:uncharacterized protein LOC107038835 [Diachasma alloeum]
MSRNASSQAKQWVAAIQANEFTKVQREIENYRFEDKASQVKTLLRLLIYLCQTATKCPATNHQTGYEISDLSEAICKDLAPIPTTSDYFCSLYHIVRVLLGMKLFERAMTIANYLMPTSTWHHQILDECKNPNDNYTKLGSIFFVSIDKFLRSKKPGSLTPPTFQQILTVIKYQLNIEEFIKSDGSKSLLLKLLHYTEFLKHLQCSKEEFDDFTDKFFLKSLSSTDLQLGDRNRFSTYDNFTKIVSTLSLHYIKSKRLETLRKILKKLLKNFDSCMLESRESSKCHQILKDFSKIFVRPQTNFTKNDAEEIVELARKFQVHIVSYGENSLIKSNFYATASILEALFALWSESPQSSFDHLSPEVITTTASLVNYLSEIIRNYQVDSLCRCGSKNCLVLQDKLKSCQLKSKIVLLLYRLCPKSELPPEFFELFLKVSSQCVDLLQDLQEKNCEKWKEHWFSLAASIYNFSLTFSSSHYEKSLEVCTFLASSIIRLKATDEDKLFFQSTPTPPLSLALHRISNMCYGSSQFHEARIFTAINVYLHPRHPECKGYRNWSFIHYKDPSSRGLTLVEFLWKHSDDLRVLGLGPIRLKNEELKDICLREIKSHIGMSLDLSESILAVLNTLETLNADAINYGTAVHQLGHHSLLFQSKISLADHLRKAIEKLKSLKLDRASLEHVQYLLSHLTLYEALEEIRSLEEATKTEMKNANIKLYASSTNGISSTGSNVVPGFSKINITTAKTLASRLEDIYNLWKKSFTPDSVAKWNSFDGTSTVKAVIVAGEYSRFYRYKDLEIKFWRMGYDLAVKTDNFEAVVYITGRSVMSRYIRDDWIKNAEEIIASNLVNSKESKVPAVISMFKMSLADYYYYIGRTGEADKLFDEGITAAPLNLSENCGTFIFSQHIALAHRFHNYPPEKRNNLEYTGIIAHTLYTMLLIDDTAGDLKDLSWSLYEMDMLLEVSCNVSIRMNALFSFREITAHLARRLKVCQPKMSVLRVAEMLKYLCLIDLSRNQLEDCEVKLQGMEFILQMEMFEGSMQREFMKIPDSSAFTSTVSPHRGVEPIRDIPQNDSSPILRREKFATPDFVSHEHKCRCFRCGNEAYKFLVFSCTHIRAQLYSLQNLKHYARQHFEGALNISERLLNLSRKEDNYQFQYVIDYVLFLLDYVRFLKKDPSTYDEGRRVVCWALEICDIYRLECHPVYESSMDIVVEYSFEKVFPEGLPRSSLVIPGVNDIDIDEYLDPQVNTPDALCVTPAKDSGNSPRPRSRSPRRNQAPILDFSKATVDAVESDPEELSPALVGPDKRKKRVVTRVKPVRRKLAEDDDFNQDEEATPGKDASGGERGDRSLRFKELVDEGVLVAPNLSRRLHALRRKWEGPITDDVLQKLIDVLEEGKREYEKSKSRGRSRRALGSDDIFLMNARGVERIVEAAKAMMGGETRGGSGEASGARSRGSGSGRSSRKGSIDAGVAKIVEGVERLSVKASGSRVDAVTKGVERLSVKSTRPRDLSVPGIKINGGEDVGSDDEVVESSYVEPRRSRRLVGKDSTTETKLSRKRL